MSYVKYDFCHLQRCFIWYKIREISTDNFCWEDQMAIKNFYSIRPDQIEDGDVFVVTVAVHISKNEGLMTYRAYRCPYPNPEIGEDGTPQGDRIFADQVDTTVETLIPVLRWADAHADAF
jgi:hypothetical protein